MADPAPTRSAPKTGQAARVITAATMVTVLLGLSGLTLTVTVVSLVLATPLLFLFSPVLVPAAVVVFLSTIGLVMSGGFGVTALSGLAWFYRYASGRRPVGSDRVDVARARVGDYGWHVRS
ncbi:hypothetical protein QJS04_geneDACA002585 [Acorus gramineus]|uniref:Oleosin n=1 Tax=Acorus gramineus TaxID=55184 RepID=A0AAV9AU67_ACOGR|nr:hypothetical protein QJS04_geneDACA023617 [Acorus gramineus]KAK1267517.1 hypothetical protein QJS04_geneDACA002585 [Acorus gramineus]